MKFYIQMGHGMQKHCRTLCSDWKGATVILSPKDLHPTEKLISFASSIKKENGEVLLDPQLYTPRKYHKNLQKHSYWPEDDITRIELGDCKELLAELAEINASIESNAFILPSNLINKVDDLWGRVQEAISFHGREVAGNQKLLLTVALGKEVLIDESQIESIVGYAEGWDIDGVYIVCEHPDSQYLVDNPIWMANLLSLVAGFKRLEKDVVVGYANHQMLPLALAKCDAIAAGNFLNVRWFQPENFETTDNDDISQRTTWYYCPQALSEFKITYLDIANRAGILDRMAPPQSMVNPFSDILFSGAMPSSTNFKEPDSFLHYLHCLKIQCENASRSSYNDTRNALIAQLETAARLLEKLHEERIKGQKRDFREIVDVNEAAIHTFDKEYGFAMAKEWC